MSYPKLCLVQIAIRMSPAWSWWLPNWCSAPIGILGPDERCPWGCWAFQASGPGDWPRCSSGTLQATSNDVLVLLADHLWIAICSTVLFGPWGVQNNSERKLRLNLEGIHYVSLLFGSRIDQTVVLLPFSRPETKTDNWDGSSVGASVLFRE